MKLPPPPPPPSPARCKVRRGGCVHIGGIIPCLRWDAAGDGGLQRDDGDDARCRRVCLHLVAPSRRLRSCRPNASSCACRYHLAFPTHPAFHLSTADGMATATTGGRTPRDIYIPCFHDIKRLHTYPKAINFPFEFCILYKCGGQKVCITHG